MSICVQVSGTQELERYQQLLETLSDPKHKVELLDSLGGIVESQTRRRIADEKTSPDGHRWDDWSSSLCEDSIWKPIPFARRRRFVGLHPVPDAAQPSSNWIATGLRWRSSRWLFWSGFKCLLIRALSHKPLVKRWHFRSISL